MFPTNPNDCHAWGNLQNTGNSQKPLFQPAILVCSTRMDRIPKTLNKNLIKNPKKRNLSGFTSFAQTKYRPAEPEYGLHSSEKFVKF